MTDFDIAGIGLGPFNLGLAALTRGHRDLSSVFLERKPRFGWHEGMMLPGTTLQVPFFADLVTMADPTHPLSYLNYLKAQDRLYQFYYYDSFLIPRSEYNAYCKWAAAQMPCCRFGETVRAVAWQPQTENFLIRAVSTDGRERGYSARNLSLGVGTYPVLPDWAQVETRAPVLHSAEFTAQREALVKGRRVAVVGSGQSAAECVLSLMQDLTPDRVASGASVTWLTRSPGFHPMEYSKIGQECFTPAYMSYFQRLPRSKRREIVRSQDLLYKGISIDTIADIFDLMYERSVGGGEPGLTLASNCAVEQLLPQDGGAAVRMVFRHRELDQLAALDLDGVVLATGYGHQWPTWLQALKAEILETDAQGDFLVNADFVAQRRDGGSGRVFVQNAEIFQQGVGGPDLGIGAYRNAIILNQLLGHTHYRIPARTAFQTYGLPDAAIPLDKKRVAR